MSDIRTALIVAWFVWWINALCALLAASDARWIAAGVSVACVEWMTRIIIRLKRLR